MWVTIKNSQFKHFNFCMNNLDDDIEPFLTEVLSRTNDDFGVTVSSNKLTEDVVENIHNKIRTLHKLNVELAIQQAEAEGKDVSEI